MKQKYLKLNKITSFCLCCIIGVLKGNLEDCSSSKPPLRIDAALLGINMGVPGFDQQLNVSECFFSAPHSKVTISIPRRSTTWSFCGGVTWERPIER